MSSASEHIPDNVLDALGRGHTIEAIKLLRAANGLGLAEAKSIIEAYRKDNPIRTASGAMAPALPTDVVNALHTGDKIEAIKRLRAATGLGLKEARDKIEASAQAKASRRGNLSPGEMPKSGTMLGWMIALAAAGLAVYLMFGA